MAIKFAPKDAPPPKRPAKVKSLQDLRELVPAVVQLAKKVVNKSVAVAPPIAPKASVAPPAGFESAGRNDPKMNLRMKPEEWDMLDRLRGKLSRNDMIRVLVIGADRITGGQ